MTNADGSGTGRSDAWRNWGGNVVANPARVVAPTGVDDVVAAIERARDDGLRVRPVGAGHSFSPLVATDGVLLDLRFLSGLLQLDRARGRITVGAGTRLAEVSSIAKSVGLALANLGDIDRQTIAGAIGTGTHGTGLRFGSISSQVAGVTMVLASGELLTVSDSEHAELLPAVRLGLGALGVVVAVTLQCVPAFGLHAEERTEAMDAVLDSFAERASAADHFELYWFPYTSLALTKTNTRIRAESVVRPPTRLAQWLQDDVVQNGLFELSCRVSAAVPAATAGLNRIGTRLVGDRAFDDDSHAVFTSPRRVRFVESEYALPLPAVPETLRALRDAIERRRLPISFPVEVRVAGNDDSAWLSTAFGRDTGYIAVHAYHRRVVPEYFALAESIFTAAGGRPHWGKLHTRDTPALRAAYPRFDDFLAARDRLDPHGVFRCEFLDRILGVPSLSA